MIRFGPHVSIAGGIENAPKNAQKVGADIYQIFTRSPRGGPAKFGPDNIKKLKERNQEYGYEAFYIHTPYYINLASEKEKTRQNSIRIIAEELEAAEKMEAKYIMTHLGSAGDSSEEKALERIRQSVKQITQKTNAGKLLLEGSAGQGNTIGHTFEQLTYILKDADIGGICLDTAHVFEAGHDIKTKAGLEKTLQQFDDIIGLEQLKLWHCNDSATELDSRKDRHEHIGHGYIGKDGFRTILNHPKLQNFDFVLETPKDSYTDDIRNLKTLRQLTD